MKHQKGFTLVEMAIVLVIIGLLLGGVLKGQELIDNSRIKNGMNDINGVVAAYNGYIDRFRRTPGDDGPLATLTARGGNWTAVTQAGDNNGVWGITEAQTFTGGGEGDNFWQHVRAAGFITGNPADAAAAAVPRNAFGGLIGVAQGTAGGIGMPAPIVCLSQVPGKAARAIDTAMDDGVANTGSVRSTQSVAGQNTAPAAPAGAAYSDDQQYTLCRSM